MALILLIETTTSVCSVALAQNEEVKHINETNEPNSHSSKLSILIDELLKESGLNPMQLDAVAVSAGPGSYTGLRIGVSTAKGICYALEKPLLSVDTLESFAYGMKTLRPGFEGYFCPMIDARRMEVYSAVFESNLTLARGTQADIVDEFAYKEYLDKKPVLFFGDGASKSAEILNKHQNAFFDFEFRASAKWMYSKALQKYQMQQFEDVVYFEPFYLKDFVAHKPVVKGLKES